MSFSVSIYIFFSSLLYDLQKYKRTKISTLRLKFLAAVYKQNFSGFNMPLSQTHNMSTSSSSSIWLLSYGKLKFFTRIRRFLRSKAARKRFGPSSDHSNKLSIENSTDNNEEEVKESELDDSMELQKSVKKLHFGSWEEKEMAAKAIEKLAKEDVKARKLMAELGVIHMLVSMVATDVIPRRRAAIKALIELANGTFTNKAIMLEDGILSKLPEDINEVDEQTRNEFAELLLSLSSISNTHISLATSKTLKFVIGTMESTSNLDTKESCLGVLCNLSAVLENSGPLVNNGVVNVLLKLSSFKQVSEKALAGLSHLVVCSMGKKAMEESPVVPESLIDVLTWEDKPKCQELSAYILMILAHQSFKLRDKMSKAGIVPLLLEVSLLGSPLAQKRAMKLLQWFKDERQARMGPHSGPQTGRVSIGSPLHPREAEEGKKMMKNLVKQSLHKNMEMITRRANAAVDDSSKLKSLVLSTSSKSLPY